MFIYLLITTIFLCTLVWVVVYGEKAKDVFCSMHLLFFVIFVILLHIAGLLSGNDRNYEMTVYLSTHPTILIYFISLSAGILFFSQKGFIPQRTRLFEIALAVKDHWLLMSFCSWILMKIYLVSVYGASSFSQFKQLAGKYAIAHYDAWWEMPIELYSNAFAVGACVVYVIKVILEKNFWRKRLLVSLSFVAFVILYVVTHSSTIGPRRFLLLLSLLSLLVLAMKGGKTLSLYLLSRWRVVMLIGFILASLTVYYQSIRNNFFQPEIADKLTSTDPKEFLSGVAMFLVPIPKHQRITKKIAFFREGPFDIIYDVIQRRNDGYSGTHGEITLNAFMTIIPRVVTGNSKIEMNADDFLEAQMNIAPSGPYIRPDVATSLLAIFIADFGIVGIILAPMVIIFTIVSFLFLLKSKWFDHPLFNIYLFSALLITSANVEGSFAAILSNLRNGIILFVVLVPFSFMHQNVW